MNHTTHGIILRTVKYGETSIIASVFTEIFGVQSYIVNGVRVSSKKGAGKANLFQPAAILDLANMRSRHFSYTELNKNDNLFGYLV